MKDAIYIVLYDVTDDKKRNRAAKLLQQHGLERIQLSVFTGLHNPKKNKVLWQQLSNLVNAEDYPDDKIFCFAISKKSFREMKVIGNFGADTDYLLGEKHTMIF